MAEIILKNAADVRDSTHSGDFQNNSRHTLVEEIVPMVLENKTLSLISQTAADDVRN